MLQMRPPMEEDWQSSGQIAGHVPFPTPSMPDDSFPAYQELQDPRLLDPPKGRASSGLQGCGSVVRC